MGAIGALFAASTAANAMGTASSTYGQAQAIKSQGQYKSNQLEFNSKVAELQAEDAIIRGEKDIKTKKRQVRQVIGSQRAALAAQGIEVNADTALQLQEDTAGLGAEDIVTIKNNAMREAWGYKVQALDYSGQAKFEKLSSKYNANQTILTGGLQFAKDISGGAYSFSKYKKNYGTSINSGYNTANEGIMG